MFCLTILYTLRLVNGDKKKKIITFTTKWTIVVGSRGRRGCIISLYLIIVAAVVDSFTNV